MIKDKLTAFENLKKSFSGGNDGGNKTPLFKDPLDRFIKNPFTANNDSIKKLIPLPVDIVNDNSMPIPLPVKMASDIAKETTQLNVVEMLEKIKATFSTGLGDLIDVLKPSTSSFNEESENKRDWQQIAKNIGGGVSEAIQRVLGGITTAIGGTTSFLIERHKIAKEQLRHTKSMDNNLDDFIKNQALNDLRDSALDENKSVGSRMRSAIEDKIASMPDESTIKKALQSTSKLATFFGVMAGVGGGWMASKIIPALASMAGKGGVIAKVGQFLLGFAKLAKVFTGIAGIIILAPVMDLFRNPETIGKYMKAFSDLWTKAILPTLKYLDKMVLRPLAVILAGAIYVMDKAMLFLGGKINFLLIGIIEGITSIFVLVGNLVKATANSAIEVFNRLLGAFFIGKYGGEGIFRNILSAFESVGKLLIDIVDISLTWIIKELGMSEIFGLKDGEGLYARLLRWLNEDLPNFIMDQLKALLNKINPIGTKRVELPNGDIMEYGKTGNFWKKPKLIKRKDIGDVVPIPQEGETESSFLERQLQYNLPKSNSNVLDIIQQRDKMDYEGSIESLSKIFTEDRFKKFIDTPQSWQTNNIVIAPDNSTVNNSSSSVVRGGGSDNSGAPTLQPETSFWDKSLSYGGY